MERRRIHVPGIKDSWSACFSCKVIGSLPRLNNSSRPEISIPTQRPYWKEGRTLRTAFRSEYTQLFFSLSGYCVVSIGSVESPLCAR
jgi:hypothetical protein